jgi:hypothetical protein
MAATTPNQEIEVILIQIVKIALIIAAGRSEVEAALKQQDGFLVLKTMREQRMRHGQGTQDLDRMEAGLMANVAKLQAWRKNAEQSLRVLHSCHQQLMKLYD